MPMETRQKLAVTLKMLGYTQSRLAERLGVSHATLNSWINGKSEPRPTLRAAIDELFLEVTGQKTIPEDLLTAKKQALHMKASAHRNVVREILENPDIRDELVLKLTYHSNAMEGSTLTEPDTAAILFDDATVPHKSLIEHLEAKNHQAALGYMLEHASQGKGLDEDFVRRLHAMLMNGIRPDAGAYRDHGVRIAGVPLPTANHLSVPKLMSELMARIAKGAEDRIGLSADAHAAFEKIHPFSDGNGRVGRLLMNAMLLRENLAPAIIRREQKRAYDAYLFKAQMQEDASQLQDFVCDAIAAGFGILERK